MNFSDHLAKKGVKNLFYLTALENLESILERGILCRNLAREYNPVDISSGRVQRSRMGNFPEVHQYVPLFFADNTPMLNVCTGAERGKGNRDDVILLNIAIEAANSKEALFSDGNVGKGAIVYGDPSDLNKLGWDIIYLRSPAYPWEDRHGRNWGLIRSSEFLMHESCEASYIQGVYFQSRLAEGWSRIGKTPDDSGCAHKIFVENSLTPSGIAQK